MDKKITDKETVNALKCHLGLDTQMCTNCAYLKYGSSCVENLFSDLFNLITHLQVENENLQKRNVILRGSVDTQKAENERLKPFKDKIAEFKSHIRVEDMLVFANSLEEWLEFCDNLKTKAYKECIEKVKEKSKKTEIVCSGKLITTNYTISARNFNKLSKELVGEDNESI